MARHVFGKDPGLLRAARLEREARRSAKVVVSVVRIQCPHCAEPVPVEDDQLGHSEAVFGQPGCRTCDNCQKSFTVPDLSTVFREIRVLRGR